MFGNAIAMFLLIFSVDVAAADNASLLHLRYARARVVKDRLLAAVQKDPPYMADGVPVTVMVQIVMYSLDSLSEASMDYSMTIYLRQRWSDVRLTYANESIVPDPIQLDNDEIDAIWVPDLYFVNEKSGFTHANIPNKLLHIGRNGAIAYSMRFNMKLICNMNLRNYPLDVQVCPIVIESYGQTTDHLIFHWIERADNNEPVKTHKNLKLSHFRLTGVSYNDCSSHYKGLGNYSCISANVTLTRDVSYYIIQIYLPSLLVVVLSWVSFWLHVEATPARISLGVLTILTLSTQASGIRPTLPKVSYIKALDVWMAVCMTFVFAALLEFAVVNMYTRGDSVSMKDRIKSFRIRSKVNQHIENGGKAATNESQEATVSPQAKKASLAKARQIDNISRALFPLTFLIFNIGYWVFYTQDP